MFLVCGEALYDVFTTTSTPRGPVGLSAVVGGSPFNIAVGLARLGEEVALFAGVSTDPLGERLAQHLVAEGVGVEHLRRLSQPTTLALVSLDGQGLPHYTFYGHGAADVSLAVEDLPGPGASFTGVHVGSYTLVRPPIADALAALVARERGKLVTLDPNVRATVEPDMAIWRARIAALLPFVSVVKVSDEDLALLAPGAPVEQVARRWLAGGPALVVVTRGGEGVVALTADDEIRVAAPKVEVADTVGAGDTFQAALIAGLLREGVRRREDASRLPRPRLEAILRRAAIAAAITCQRRGADLPRAAEIDAFAP